VSIIRTVLVSVELVAAKMSGHARIGFIFIAAKAADGGACRAQNQFDGAVSVLSEDEGRPFWEGSGWNLSEGFHRVTSLQAVSCSAKRLLGRRQSLRVLIELALGEGRVLGAVRHGGFLWGGVRVWVWVGG
jgi:hypothetical protein